MSERDLEDRIMAAYEKQGYKVKRANPRNRGADFYAEAPDGRKVAVEVKTRRVGVPDVLSVASSNYSVSIGKSPAPVIVSSDEVLPFADQVALQNGVTVVRFEDQDIDPRIRFVDSFTLLIELLARFERLQTRNPVEVIEHAAIRLPLLSPSDLEALRKLLDTRNRVAHQKEMPEYALEVATATCKALITRLTSKS